MRCYMITDRLCKIIYVCALKLFAFAHTKEPHFQLEPLNNGSRGRQIVQDYQNQHNHNFYTKTSLSFCPQNQTFFNHEQLKSAAILAFLKAHMSKSDFQKLKHNLQIKCYGVNADYLKNVLYKKSFEELENWLIKNKKLTKTQALNIWTSFCEHKNFRWKKKSNGYAHIEQEYNQRKKNTVTQQQKIQPKQKNQQPEAYKPALRKNVIISSQDLESRQEQYALPPTYLCQGIDSKTLQKRQNTLQKTIEQNYAQYEQSYFLNPQTTAYLQTHDLKPTDYTSCFGTPLQQQLHTEVCQLFDQIAQQESKIMFATDAINFTDATHDQNQKEQIATAITLADIAWTLAAIPIGICERAKDTVMLPFHAPQIIKCLGQALYFVIETSIINNLAKYTNLPKAIQERDERDALIKQGIVQAASAIYNATWHDKIKGSTRLIADFYVPGKIFHAAGYLFAGVAAQSKKLRSLENVAAMMDHDSGFAEMVEEILETTKRLEPATPEGLKGQILAEFMEAESTISKISKTIIKFSKDTFPHRLNKFPENKNSLHHLFRNKEGHIAGTIENKEMLLNLVQSAKNCSGEIEGVIWYSKLEKNGEQLWACVWRETQEIRNCGINKKPRIWDPDSGYNINRLNRS